MAKVSAKRKKVFRISRPEASISIAIIDIHSWPGGVDPISLLLWVQCSLGLSMCIIIMQRSSDRKRLVLGKDRSVLNMPLVVGLFGWVKAGIGQIRILEVDLSCHTNKMESKPSRQDRK